MLPQAFLGTLNSGNSRGTPRNIWGPCAGERTGGTEGRHWGLAGAEETGTGSQGLGKEEASRGGSGKVPWGQVLEKL